MIKISEIIGCIMDYPPNFLKEKRMLYLNKKFKLKPILCIKRKWYTSCVHLIMNKKLLAYDKN